MSPYGPSSPKGLPTRLGLEKWPSPSWKLFSRGMELVVYDHFIGWVKLREYKVQDLQPA